MKKDGCIIYGSFYDAAQCIKDPAKRLLFFECICAHGLGRELPDEIPDDVRGMLEIAKANIDAAHKRYERSVENGKKGGRPPKAEKNDDGSQKPWEQYGISEDQYAWLEQEKPWEMFDLYNSSCNPKAPKPGIESWVQFEKERRWERYGCTKEEFLMGYMRHKLTDEELSRYANGFQNGINTKGKNDSPWERIGWTKEEWERSKL